MELLSFLIVFKNGRGWVRGRFLGQGGRDGAWGHSRPLGCHVLAKRAVSYAAAKCWP